MRVQHHSWTVPLLSLLLSFFSASLSRSAERPSGRIIWWGEDFTQLRPDDRHPNGAIESGGEILSNIVAIAARNSQGLALKSDGTVFAFGRGLYGGDNVPPGLSNVVSIAAEGSSYWAMRRDGTVEQWGGDEDSANIVAGLNNVTAVAWAGYRSYLALKTDGTLYGFRFDISDQAVDPATGLPVTDPTTGLPVARIQLGEVQSVKVRGEVLRDIVGVASLGESPLVLKKDGTVFRLVSQLEDGMGGPTAPQPPYQYSSAELVKVGDEVLTNVMALAGGGHCLALKSNGTVVAWGMDLGGETKVPAGLSNVVAIAAAWHLSLALKRDGTVVAWGGNSFGQISVPSGLSNVVGIASGSSFGLALTTGAIPTNVFIPPHGRLEEMEREADLIFKGQAVSSIAVTNSMFPAWAKTRATRFSLISVLKGTAVTNEPVLWHITGRPGAWSGASQPTPHEFEVGQSYLVFAKRLDKPDYLYTPPADATNRQNEFRQMYLEGVTRTLDKRPITAPRVKDAHWAELNLLLNDTTPSNQLYAVAELNRLSKAGNRDDRWNHSEDFKRQRVLDALHPLITNSNDVVAVAALRCFQLGAAYTNTLEPHIPALIQTADEAPSVSRRVAAIAAFTDQPRTAISNALPRWLHDTNSQVRATAVTLLPRYPGEFQEQALVAASKDPSAHVRGVVADAIGETKRVALLPTLEELFATSTKPTNSSEPRTFKLLWYPDYAGDLDVKDVHTSAGLALLRFDVEEVGQILKRHLSDTNFGLRFVRKLAPDGDEVYVPLLLEALRTHTAGSEQEAAKNGFHWPLSYWLSGNYGWAWDRLFAHVSKQTREALEGQEMAPILDVLQIADDPGDARTRTLYEFFLDKGLLERAKEVRRGIIRRTEDKNINKASFGFPEKLKAFDEMDRKHSLKPGLGV